MLIYKVCSLFTAVDCSFNPYCLINSSINFKQEFSIKFNTCKSGLPNVYIEGSNNQIELYFMLSLKILS